MVRNAFEAGVTFRRVRGNCCGCEGCGGCGNCGNYC